MNKTPKPWAARCPTTGSTAPSRRILSRGAAVLLLLLVWQLIALWVGQDFLLPTPLAVLAHLFALMGEPGFWLAVQSSFLRIVGGFLCALLLGLLLGGLAGCFPLLEILLFPFTATIKAVPVASIIILCLIWLSPVGLPTFIAFLMVLPVVYANTLTGIHAVDRDLAETAWVFSLSLPRRLLYLWSPQLKPYLLSACSVGLGLSWKAGITAEILGIPPGSMGRMLYDAKLYLDTLSLLSWTVAVVAVSVLFEKLFLFLLRRGFARLEAR